MNQHISFSEAKENIKAAIAKDLKMDRKDLKPWEHYDPIDLDERAYQITKGLSGVVWTGD
jgi:hypothetical protein